MRFRFIEDRRADYPVTILCSTNILKFADSKRRCG